MNIREIPLNDMMVIGVSINDMLKAFAKVPEEKINNVIGIINNETMNVLLSTIGSPPDDEPDKLIKINDNFSLIVFNHDITVKYKTEMK